MTVALSNLVSTLRLTGKKALEWIINPPVGGRFTRPFYWTVAPAIYRRFSPTDFEDRGAAPDQFKIERVDPRRIRRFTPRVYPPWHDRTASFGRVECGNWDRQSYDETPSYGGPPMDLFYADSIEQGLLYQAIESHFIDEVPWEDTRFVQRVIEYLDDGREFVWRNCASREDVFTRCSRLEDIHRSMRRRGCLSHRELTPPSRREEGFFRCMEQEIIVDVGRNGELLLVSGKHRYSLARVLGLDEIPVTFLVRHAKWMDIRRGLASGTNPALRESMGDHPDLRDLSMKQ